MQICPSINNALKLGSGFLDATRHILPMRSSRFEQVLFGRWTSFVISSRKTSMFSFDENYTTILQESQGEIYHLFPHFIFFGLIPEHDFFLKLGSGALISVLLVPPLFLIWIGSWVVLC
jgi:hypothetical protein